MKSPTEAVAAARESLAAVWRDGTQGLIHTNLVGSDREANETPIELSSATS